MKEFKFSVQKFVIIRKTTDQICKPILIEEYVVQPDYDVSPLKWHHGNRIT